MSPCECHTRHLFFTLTNFRLGQHDGYTDTCPYWRQRADYFYCNILYVWKITEKIYTANQNFWAFGDNARSRSAHQQFIKHLYKKHSVRAVANSLFVRNILWNSKSNPTFIARFISRKFKNDILATTCYIELRAICNKSGAIVNHSHSKYGLETQLKSLCTHGHWTHCILV